MPVRLCNVITRMIVGGPQQVSLLVGDYYRDRPGFEYHLVSGTESGPEGDYHQELRARGIDWHPVPQLVRELQPITDLRSVASLARLFRRLQPDIVHRAVRQGAPRRTSCGTHRSRARCGADRARLVVQQCR